MTHRFLLTFAIPILLSACGNVAAIGHNKTQCEEDPSACVSTRQAYMNSNGSGTIPGSSSGNVPMPGLATSGAVAPPANDAVSLSGGNVMRIWTAPTQSPSGALHVSGYTFVELDPRQWKVGFPDYIWTAQP